MGAPLFDAGVVVPYSPEMGKWLGDKTTLYLQQIWYFQTITTHSFDGKKVFYCSDKKWSEFFGWSKSTFVRARQVLMASGIIEVYQLNNISEAVNSSGPLWYHINRQQMDVEWEEYQTTGVKLFVKYASAAQINKEEECQNETGPSGKMEQALFQNETSPSTKMKQVLNNIHRVNKDSCVSSFEKEETCAPDSSQFQLTMEQDGVDPDQPEPPRDATWQEVVGLYNSICKGPGFTVCNTTLFADSSSLNSLRQRMKPEAHRSLDFWESYFRRIEASDWLSLRNGEKRGKTTIHFLLEKRIFIKVWEGTYDNRR